MPTKSSKSTFIVKPADAPEFNPAEPDQNLKLSSVFGYAGQMRSNIVLNPNGSLVYPAAAVGIIQKDGSQEFHIGHTNDISAFGSDAVGKIIATGDMCSPEIKPSIRVWDGVTGALLVEIPCLSEKRKPEASHQLQKKISAIAVSPDGTKIAAVGDDSNHSVALMSTTNNWRSFKREYISRSSTNEVNFIEFADDETFYSGGNKHLYMWNVASAEGKKCLFGCCPIDDLCCGCPCDEMFAIGTKTGAVYFYNKEKPLFSKKVHEKAVTAIAHHPDGGIISGSMDMSLMVWNKSGMPQYGFDLIQVTRLLADKSTVIGGVNAILMRDANTLVVGTKKCNILEITVTNKKVTAAQVVVEGHAPGEVWGCSAHPRDPKILVSSGDDKHMIVWDVVTHKPVKQLSLPLMSRTLDIHPTKELIAIGLGGRTGVSQSKSCDDGGFMVVDMTTMAVVHKQEKMSEEWISAIKFSPCGKYLVVGSHDNFVYIYETETYKLLFKFIKGASFVTQMDFSEDSKYLAVCYGDYQLMYVSIPSGAHIVNMKEFINVKWHTQNCTFGWGVQGIWKGTADKTDINACAVSPDKSLLVAVDDFNTVRLYRYPASEEACVYKKFYGHASHIPYCEFTFDGKKVVTAGGNDHCVMVWDIV